MLNMNTYISLFNVNVITYPNPDAGLANLC